MARPRVPLERMAARSPDGVTPGKRNLPAPVSPTTPDRSVPGLPSGLELDGRAATEWAKVWNAGFWLKRDQDYHWVEMIARAYADIEAFRARVELDGLVVTGYNGQPAAHPLISEIRKAESAIQKCLQILGFSPTDRAKLNIAEAKAQSALMDFKDKVDAHRNGS